MLYTSIVSVTALLLTTCGEFLEDARKQNVTPTLFTQSIVNDSTSLATSEFTNFPTSSVPKKSTNLPEPKCEKAFTEFPILRGMNIGNALEAPSPGEWGMTIRREYIQATESVGFNAIRIPVRFSSHTGQAPEYLIDDEILQLVDEVIDWGLESGLVVILDLHHFEELMQNPISAHDQFIAIWQQLAEHFQNTPPELYFELLNEPSMNLDADTWNALIEESLGVIRKTNPSRKIIIGGINFSNVKSLFLLKLPSDRNLIATFHFYEPFELTHQGASWVTGSSNWLGTDWKGSQSEKQTISQALDLAVDWSNYHKIPIIMGEFGVIQKADPLAREKWTKFVVQEAEKREISWLYWELCLEFGVYDCRKAIWDDTILNALINQ